MTGYIWFPIILTIIMAALIIISDSPIARTFAVLSIIINMFSITARLPLPGTEATARDVQALIKDCEKELPRHHKCVIDIGLRVDDGTTDYE